MALTTLTKIGKGITSSFEAKGATHSRGLDIRFSDTANILDYGVSGLASEDASLAFVQAYQTGKPVYIPSGIFTFRSELPILTGNVTILGDGRDSVLCQSLNANILTLNDVTVNIRGVHLKGGNYENKSGIKISNGGNVSISECYFSNIGTLIGRDYSGCIICDYCTNVKVTDNYFDNSCKSITGADVGVGYGTNHSLCSGNISRSEMDAFYSSAAVTLIEGDTFYHSICNNIATRKMNSTSRHGVLLDYAQKQVFGTVSGNVLAGFNWTGVYLQNAEGGSTTLKTGGASVSNNVIAFCGGDLGSSSTGTITAGIYLSGLNGQTCTGNLLYWTGMNIDGSIRKFETPSIYMLSHADKCSVTGNVISGGYGQGISLSTLDTFEPPHSIVIMGNVVKGCTKEALSVTNNRSTAELAEDVIISNNIFDSSHTRSVSFGGFNGATKIGRLVFNFNTIKSSDVGVWSNLSNLKASFNCNTYEVSGIGVHIHNFGLPNLYVGDQVTFDKETFIGCSTPFDLSGKEAIIGTCYYQNTTNTLLNSQYEIISTGHSLNLSVKTKPTNTALPDGTIVWYADPVPTLGSKRVSGSWVDF